MKIAAISDLHGYLEPVHKILDLEKPELLLCAGDWGTEEEISQADLESVTQKIHTFTIYGNNDALDFLPKIKNQNDASILITTGSNQQFDNLIVGGINGIWAKSHQKPWYITDEEVIEAAHKLGEQSVDILMTHECPVGMADLTPVGRHGGKRSFTEAFKIVQPKLHICGHLHRKSSYKTKDGKWVVNVGQSSEGDYLIVYYENNTIEFESRII